MIAQEQEKDVPLGIDLSLTEVPLGGEVAQTEEIVIWAGQALAVSCIRPFRINLRPD